MGTILGSSSGPPAAGLGDLGEPPSSPGLSLPVGTRRTLRAQAGRPAEAGPGWEQDRPLRRAGTSRARGGGARGSSPGAGVAAPAAGGSAAAASAPAADRRRGRGPALRPPPPSGCSRGVGGGVPADPKPSRCRSLVLVRARRPVGQPLTKSARSASARAAPPMQVRARSPRRKVLGGLPVPTPRACASCILPAAWLPPGRPPPCAQLAPPTPGDPRPPPVLVSPLLAGRWWRPRTRSGSATVKSLDSIKVLLKFSRSAWCSAKSGKPGGRRSGFRYDLGQRQLSE